MKAYKVEILIIDLDEIGQESIVQELTFASFPNDCLHLDVKNIECKDIGEWHDAHPLNRGDTRQAEYLRLFPKNS